MNRAHPGPEQLSTVTRHQGHLGVRHLARGCLATELHDRFEEPGEVGEVVTGEQSPARVDLSSLGIQPCKTFSARSP